MDPAQNDDENSLPISPVIVKDSLAQIAQIAQIDPSETAIGRPTATAHRLVRSDADGTEREPARARPSLTLRRLQLKSHRPV